MQYWVNGWITAAIATRLPEIAENLGIGFGNLGLILGGQAITLIIALLAAERVARRVGVVKIGIVGTAAFAALAWLPAEAASPATLAAALALVAIVNGPLDACVPAMVADIERRRGKSSFSLAELGFVTGAACGGAGALWSVGRITVSEFLTGAASVGLVVAGVAAVVLAIWWRRLPPAKPERDEAVGGRARGRWMLALVASVAFCSLWAEGALVDWSTFLFRERGYEGGAYVAGYVAFTLGLSVVLLLGGSLIDRFGAVRVARAGGLAFAAGVAIALTADSLVLASAGLALAGIGLGNVHPVAMSAAGGIHPRGRSIALVNALSYAGLVLSKPTIGQAAEAFSLQTALSTLIGFGLLMALLARAVRGAQSGGREEAPSSQ